MTPTEIQAAVESALANKVILPWWSYLSSVLIVASGAYFGVYLKEKGRNLATREDIKDITDKIEKVRSDYRKENDRYQLLASGLLKKRAEAIERLYQLVVDIEEAFAKFVDTFEWSDVLKVDLRKEASNMLYQFFENTKNREFILVMTCVKDCRNSRTYSIKLRSRYLLR